MKKNTAIEVLGWYGTIAIVGAYFLNSFGMISADSIWYQILNTTGAVGIVLASYIKKAYQPMVLNVIWTAIGGIALIKLLLQTPAV